MYNMLEQQSLKLPIINPVFLKVNMKNAFKLKLERQRSRVLAKFVKLGGKPFGCSWTLNMPNLREWIG